MDFPEIQYLILSVTDRCNLSCRYCYRSASVQGEDMGTDIVERAMSLVDHGKPCHVQVTGGEPLLLPEQVELIGRLAGEMKRQPRLGIQTNATLMSQELAAMLKQYGFVVGVSLDGPPAIHDTLRGKAAETLKGLRLLESMDIDFGITTVVTAHNALVLDQLILLLAGFSNSRGLGLDLLTDRGRGLSVARAAEKKDLQLGLSKMMKVLSFVNRSRTIPLKLRETEICDNPRIAFCRAAMGESLAISPLGELYPCGQTMGDPDFAMGTLDCPERPGISPLMDCRLEAVDCKGCVLENRCPGECPSRLYYNREKGQELACILYQSINSNQ